MRAVNLIPREQRAGASGGLTGRSGGGALIVLGLLAGLAALALMYGKAHRQISSESGQVVSIAAQTSAIQARTGRLTPYASFVSMAHKRVQTVTQLVQSRFDWSHSLHELGRVLPVGASISTLQASIGASAGPTVSTTSSTSSTASAGATPASSTPAGSVPVFTLTGCAVSQSEVAQTLQRLRLMNGATEVKLQSSTKSASGGSGSSGGGCPSGDPAFSAEVTFAALPATATPSVSGVTPASSSAAHGAGTEPVSAKGSGVPR
jgi:Tfp pilus assembly protein PilN